jgi:murein L,D-transpeptidase YafK
MGALQAQIASLEEKVAALRAPADKVLIEKQARRLTLFSKGEVIKTYKIALGGNPEGPKERLGDNKTPEGIYTIDGRNGNSGYHLSLHISYPNEADKRRAAALGVSPGGDIMIHGIKNGFAKLGASHAENDWTEGCIAVTNQEMEEIYSFVPDGTLVEITP